MFHFRVTAQKTYLIYLKLRSCYFLNFTQTSYKQDFTTQSIFVTDCYNFITCLFCKTSRNNEFVYVIHSKNVAKVYLV